MQQFFQALMAGLADGAIYASLALALVLIYKATEVINFAQGEMAMFTTYIAYALYTHPHFGHKLSYWYAFSATLVIAFLFGVGLAIQFDRLAGNDRRVILMVRRLAVLLAIGVVHLFLIWNGDILTEYAVVGLAALPLLYGPRWLLAAIAALSLALWLASPFLPPPISFPDAAWIAHHVEQARQVYGGGSFMQISTFRIDEVRTIAPLHVYAMPRTFGLFLLGAWMWRTGFFRPTASRGFLAAAACVMLVFGAWMTGAAARATRLAGTSTGRDAPSFNRWRSLFSPPATAPRSSFWPSILWGKNSSDGPLPSDVWPSPITLPNRSF